MPTLPIVETYKCGVTAEEETHNSEDKELSVATIVTEEFTVTFLLNVVVATFTIP